MKAKEGSENGSENGSNDDSDTEEKVCPNLSIISISDRDIPIDQNLLFLNLYD